MNQNVMIVGVGGQGHADVVVDHKGHAIAGGDFFQPQSLGQKGGVIQLLFPDLQKSGAGPQNFFHLVRQIPALQPAPVGDGVKQHGFFGGQLPWAGRTSSGLFRRAVRVPRFRAAPRAWPAVPRPVAVLVQPESRPGVKTLNIVQGESLQSVARRSAC